MKREVREYLSKIGSKGGKIGGKASTPEKARAARKNGKMGGRPKLPTKKGKSNAK
jgi:hypothetical protein